MNTKNVAVILSGGSGMRFGASLPKQYLNLAGKMIIEHTIEVFESHPMIDEICIIANNEFHENLWKVCDTNGYQKVQNILEGGSERKDSSYAAICAYETDPSCVQLIFHDAVRPFVSAQIIKDCIDALNRYEAIDVAIPSADTIIQIDPNTDTIESIPQRSTLRRGQTPQAFSLDVIRRAHESLRNDPNPINVTDDCGLVKYYLPNIPIYVVSGEEKNIKITYPEDLLFSEKLIQLNSRRLNKIFPLTTLKNQVIVVYGGHSGIGEAIVKMARDAEAHCVSFSRQNGVDLQKCIDIRTSLESVAKRYGRIDHIINCAALLTKQSLEQMNEECIEETIRINYTATAFLCKYGLPYLKSTHGSLTLFTSSSYTQGRALYALYSSTKAAIVNLVQALSQEWEPDNVRINAINPARTKTPMRTTNFGDEPEDSLLDPNDVALKTLQSLNSGYSGLIIDIKKGIDG